MGASILSTRIVPIHNIGNPWRMRCFRSCSGWVQRELSLPNCGHAAVSKCETLGFQQLLHRPVLDEHGSLQDLDLFLSGELLQTPNQRASDSSALPGVAH